ncbi:hypothetical protein BABINDRAFT_5689 [Babjeviella inositovora NRRL Y-12698]|uniref:Mitochondrial import protein 1 n=1 Tax=Babjeviella inositovora NRRL Y-12698 TaxID=984486 RepID=A0A1E3QYS0_9ASCO|nr:uncharacterized protein BABINDRAFT_5689 [Babjeviella inositovora NRRL Y-12698]ODQ82771.1 hypothetical protein BABINDRAFT_5689 [Babjeviella inositovora NRRL Y-12698]
MSATNEILQDIADAAHQEIKAFSSEPSAITDDAPTELDKVIFGSDSEEAPFDNQSISYLSDTNENFVTVPSSGTLVKLEEFSVLAFLVRCGINLVLPFINGIMVGCGEILAHEIGFRYGWRGARVEPSARMAQRQRQIQQQSKFL